MSATNEQLAEADLADARAEIARLRAENDDLFKTNGELANSMGAENLRLRAALRHIINDAEGVDGLASWEAAEIARNALNDEQTACTVCEGRGEVSHPMPGGSWQTDPCPSCAGEQSSDE